MAKPKEKKIQNKRGELFTIEFKDKDSSATNALHISPITIQNRINLGLEPFQYSDLPVSKKYMDSLQTLGWELITCSKWLNTCWVKGDGRLVDHTNELSFVTKVRKYNSPNLIYAQDKTYSPKKVVDYKLRVMGDSCLQKQQLNGKGVKIGVLDAGFHGFKYARFSKNILKNKKVLHSYDFHSKNWDVYSNYSGNDEHGLQVLKNIIGETPRRKYGFAPEAELVLARTENAQKEFRMEEVYWLKAIEWMDSLGVRLINSSLGYSIGFDNPNENYKLHEMNGETTFISKAAKMASEEKGMIIVTSAGNEGNKNQWRIVSAPADVKWVISVGALNEQLLKTSFSSIGPDFLLYNKPDVSTISLNGTSFSAPIITGLVACMLEKKPYLTIQEVLNYLDHSGHLYPFPNNYVGYGQPNACKLLDLMDDKSDFACQYDKIIVDTDSITFDEISSRLKPCNSEQFNRAVQKQSYAILYFKTNSTLVAAQMIRKDILQKKTIARWDEFNHATLVFPHQFVLEIEWRK